jgi:hypothetical protein
MCTGPRVHLTVGERDTYIGMLQIHDLDVVAGKSDGMQRTQRK